MVKEDEKWKLEIRYDDYISPCCSAPPALEMDMSTVPYGGPSGRCMRCGDNCIFMIPCYNCGDEAKVTRTDNEMYCNDCNTWIDDMEKKSNAN